MRTGIGTIIGLGVLACAPPPAPPVDTAAEVAAVNAVREQEVAAFFTGDTSLAYVTDDIVMMPPGAPQVVGKAAMRAWFGEFMALVTPQALDYGESQITVAGDWAIERYTGSLTVMPKAGGDAVTETLKGIHIYRKGADGTWKMAMDVWNADAPPTGS